MTVTLGAPELEAANQVALKHIAKETKVAGFRKGKAPLEMVAKHADPNKVNQDTLEHALSKAVAEAFIDNELQALERPQVDVKKYVPGSELEFTAEGDVLPKTKLGDYKKLKAEKQPVKVTKSDVDEVLGRIQKGFTEKQETTKPAELGDEVVIDFVGEKDGEAFPGGAGSDYALELGSNSFIPGFEEALVGKKAGDSLDVPLTFPKDYHAQDLAGQEVVFKVTIKTVNKVIVPELSDELAAKAGPFTSADELKADIKKEITAQKNREADDKLKDDLVRQLIEKSDVTVPQVLLEDQIRSIEQDLTQNLMYQGQSLEQYFQSKGYADRDAWVEAEAKETAELRIKAGLVLAELSRELGMDASDDEVAAQVNAYKQQYANNPEMAKRFDEPEIQREVANRVITEKTVNKLAEINS